METFRQVAEKIEKLLTGRRVDGFEISFASSKNLSIEVKEQKIDTFKCSTPSGVSIRVLKSGGMGFSYSTSLAENDLARMLDNAIIGAESQTADPLNGFPLPQEYPVVTGLFDENLSGISERDKIQRAMDLERLVLAADTRVKRVRRALYGESEFEVFIRNSLGVAGGYRGTSISCSVTAVAEQGEESQMGWDFGWSNVYSCIDIATIAGNAAAKAVGQLGARRIATTRCPVVLDNHVAAEILEILAPSFVAENVQKGKSMLAGRIGDRLFSGLLCVRDDGTLTGGMASAPFDAEGIPRQNTLLVANGSVKAFLYDTYSARKDGVASTGNSMRGGIKSPPHPDVSNFFIENGSVSRDAMLRGMDRGILLTDVMGMHTADPISGDFSVGAAGFLIEQGVSAYPVKGIAISGNILDLFRDVELVGNDLRFFGAVGSPSLKITALDVSGA